MSHSGRKIHKDISKRSQTVSIDSSVHTSQRFSWKLHHISQLLERTLLQWWDFLAGMTVGRWILVIFILFLSYIVYGVGFIIRTENNIRTILYAPDVDITSPRMGHLLDNLWRDYQVL